ncbi:unnamed protein product [Prorocentrum cordatum]|uniref:Uncharacterized protein n=1 Tax=Prorocentrum cordatum TaxID=2364126 RepID=A0ABN9W6C5_9DINO|nr:unnamed protein product [Polarella glacialis]
MDAEERYDLARELGPQGRRRVDSLLAEMNAEDAAKDPEAENAQRVEAAKKAARDLSKKLNFDALKEMSNEERVGLVAELGPAFAVSALIVGTCYWTLTASSSSS